MVPWLFAVICAACSAIGALAYIRLWRTSRGTTPKGYGGLLALFLVGGAVWLGQPREVLIALFIIAGMTAVYWFDDAFELNAMLRLFVQFATGFGIAWTLAPVMTVTWIGVCIASGTLNCVLTNVVNFADGADLNFAVYPILTALLMLALGPHDAFWEVAIIVLAFTMPFSVINAFPRTIYFGDSGCFAFASLLTMMAVYYFQHRSADQILAAVPTALPLFDAFWVFTMRLANREDLLSRNYHHLYQKLQERFAGFGYLLPQLLNVTVVILGAAGLERLGFGPFLSVVASGALLTPVLYMTYKYGVLQGAWHFGKKQSV